MKTLSPESRNLPESRLVRSLALATFLQWAGASAILPVLPVYVRQSGGSDAAVGAVMASFFAAGFASQYLGGSLADRIGPRRVLVMGLVVYAFGSFGFLSHVSPLGDVGLRALQGAGAGSAEVAALAMIATAVPLERRGRGFGRVFGAQLAGMAVGPLAGSLAGAGGIDYLFVAAGLGAAAACLPVIRSARSAVASDAFVDTDTADTDTADTRRTAETSFPTSYLPVGRPGSGDAARRALVGVLIAAMAIGLLTGVYESCWTLLLDFRGAKPWQVGFSWTLFAVPFVAMSMPAGRMTDRLDRRWLVVLAMTSSVLFAVIYPFIANLALLIGLGCVEAIAVAVTLPAVQSLLSEISTESGRGRLQGIFGSTQTAATAAAALLSGALFGFGPWVPFVIMGFMAGVLVCIMAIVWVPVQGHVVRQRKFPAQGLITRADTSARSRVTDGRSSAAR